MSDDMVTMTPEKAAALRAPFPDEAIGKLPRVTCPDCSKRNCQIHAKARCDECGNWITTQHIHLDYVGHAWVTHRLGEVDPLWNWEPVPNADGLGFPTAPGTMWIRLTVCGVDRFGVGDASGKTGPDAIKEMIGDAIRNAAMRFGVALDLWMKDRHVSIGSDDTSTRARQSPARSSGKRAPAKRAAKRAPEPAEQPAAGTIPTGTATQIRKEIHDRMKALPEPHRSRTFEAFAKRFGDPNDLPISKVANAVLFIGAQQKAAESGAPAERSEPEQKPATIEDELKAHLRAAVDVMSNDDLRAAWDAVDGEESPSDLDTAQERLVELALAELVAEFPEGTTRDEVAMWWNGESGE